MASPDLIVSAQQCGDINLPVNPFVSNRYHFGMLLGVADLEADQAYHRGKTWMHNAWLHGPGTIWGLRVELRAESNELAVLPGLALDAHGRELRVSDTMCVDIGRWFAERRPDDLEVTENPDGSITFTIHVELCHDSCLDRPVPSISEPCDDASFDTAYSRAIERGLPRIAAGPAPAEEPPMYPRLRQFFGQLPLTDPGGADAMVAEALAAVDAAADADKPAVCVTWFRQLTAADTMDISPEDGALSWSPVAGDGCIPLAELVVHMIEDDTGFTVIGDGADPTTIDNFVRPSHVRSRTDQELLCHGPLAMAGAGGLAEPGEPGEPEEPAGPDGPQ